jgi:hypothetical protein
MTRPQPGGRPAAPKNGESRMLIMSRRLKMVEPPSKIGDGDGGSGRNLFDRASITILGDGRVEARLDRLDDEQDELIVRTSQRKAAVFIVNDLAPAVMGDVAKIRPFGN